MPTAVPRIRTEVQIMFFDTDCGGVVSNIAYLRFIEIARTLLVEELGLALAEMAETQRYPVVVHTEIDYRHAAKLGDQLVVEGWLDHLERVRFWCAFRIIRPKGNTRARPVRWSRPITGSCPPTTAFRACKSRRCFTGSSFFRSRFSA